MRNCHVHLIAVLYWHCEILMKNDNLNVALCFISKKYLSKLEECNYHILFV